ncbi:MAG: hypothetical protein FJ308_10390, partial [Planctomycetes bacterium]|nr:hypothetical protein [Planctomycetota bacterium]
MAIQRMSAILTLGTGLLSGTFSARGEDWNQFRGGTAQSIAAGKLSETVAMNTQPAWRTEIDGSGWSQPIVVGNQVFVTTAVTKSGFKPKGMMGGVMDPSTMGKGPKPKDPIQWKLVCLSLDSGGILWEQTVADAIPAYSKHASNTFATETPAASADAVYAFFGAAGAMGAYDLKGNQLWTKTFEQQKISNDFGTGSSVLLADDRVLVQMYNEESAILNCLNTNDGSELWRA